MTSLLTQNCRKEFEKWLLNWIDKNIAWETETPNQEDIDQFYCFPLAMQFEVYADFFDLKGLRIYLTESELLGTSITFYEYDGDKISLNKRLPNRTKARKEAVKKANELFNKR